MDNKELDLHKQNRNVLFENEKFLLGLLQAVSAAIIVGTLSQFEKIISISGIVPTKLLISFAAASLILALISVFLKHEYKKWDVKAASETGNERNRRTNKAGRCLKGMRSSMLLATLILCVGLLVFIVSLWECCSSTHTLYRNSVLDTNMRIHVATFDSKDGNDYNAENCDIAKNLFQTQKGVEVKYWCEPKL